MWNGMYGASAKVHCQVPKALTGGESSVRALGNERIAEEGISYMHAQRMADLG